MELDQCPGNLAEAWPFDVTEINNPTQKCRQAIGGCQDASGLAPCRPCRLSLLPVPGVTGVRRRSEAVTERSQGVTGRHGMFTGHSGVALSAAVGAARGASDPPSTLPSKQLPAEVPCEHGTRGHLFTRPCASRGQGRDDDGTTTWIQIEGPSRSPSRVRPRYPRRPSHLPAPPRTDTR